MLATLLKKYNHLRKERFFQSPLLLAKKKYAFIGVGVHSLTNLYPLLQHFRLPLKYICTGRSDWSSQLSGPFPGCIFTHDISDIINDREVEGVFICASPKAHYDLLTALLAAGKKVFVEKPPCSTLAELQELLQKYSSGICKVGLQRRYWPGNDHALKKSRRVYNYIYKFGTGPYPQGDPFTELFIHPLDYASFLFGSYSLRSSSIRKENAGLTVQLHVAHENGISGLIQLSTHYSWNPASEELSLTTPEGSLVIAYPGSVTGQPAPRRILNIPAERLLRQPVVTKQYYSAGPSIVPALESNSLVSMGFYKEIETFVSLVENGSAGSADKGNDLPSLLNVYRIIEALR